MALTKSTRIQKTVIIRGDKGEIVRAYNQVEHLVLEDEKVIANQVEEILLDDAGLKEIVAEATLADKALYEQQISDLTTALQNAQTQLGIAAQFKAGVIKSLGDFVETLKR